ncbi:hypothetical protein AMATHDRAFT_50644 [Amanita thiersii Skay4041]|uniref:Uncharacterized protein n=1 Tax=Amanita thiersii Skay4041 TaxID=703135 RepID=A0A2A9NGX7_9AGAR|nr:hypothetical protein AMATHDRAFT_50644 [Amanita thiersii Skay4041]
MTKVIARDFNDEMEPRDFYDSDGLYAREYDGELMDRDYDSNTKYPEEELKAHEDAAKLNVRDLEEEFKARDYGKFKSRKFDGELGARDIFNVDGDLETREHAAVSRRMYSSVY